MSFAVPGHVFREPRGVLFSEGSIRSEAGSSEELDAVRRQVDGVVVEERAERAS